MYYRRWLPILATVAILGAADKKLPLEQTSNDLVEISASLLDKDQVHQELGNDLDPEFFVLKVTVRSVSDKPLTVSLDDFLLLSTKDGERGEPFAPSQIAGSAALVVTQNGTRATQRARPTFGIGGLGVGTSGPTPDDAANTKVESKHSESENPLLAALSAKVLPEKEITDTVSGLLYFQMNGKPKPKDLELHYKGPGGKLAVRFKP